MKILNENASAARFLLGGIGTGNISLDQNGRLCDFELWNKPNKGFRSPFTFFALRAETPDGKVYTKALESRLAPPYLSSQGANYWEIAGISRFRHSRMQGAYPFVNVSLQDDTMPLKAEIEAFTPFIPLATDDSSLPAAMLRYCIENTTNEPLTVSVAGSLVNLAVFECVDSWTKPLFSDSYINRYTDKKNIRGIHFLNSARTENQSDYFEMALLTTEEKGVSYLEKWGDNAWWDELYSFWNDFADDGELDPNHPMKGKAYYTPQDRMPVASLCLKKTVQPGEKIIFPFIISWYHPYRIKAWDQDCPVSGEHPAIRNYYAKFGNALNSAAYLAENLGRLEGKSREFAKALEAGSFPDYVKEAVSANLTVIRSNTCFRVEDGTFFGWEGCHDTVGSCDGNCTHVWNYTQTLAFFFPELERSMRKTEFLYETDPDGRMYFRAHRYLAEPDQTNLPAADGQLGTIIRLYRDWKLCGDSDFLRQMWPNAKLALEYAFTYWDKDGDGLLDGQAHNTYDIEFYGITSMLNSIYFAALRAGEEICRYLGDNKSSEKYRTIREKGAAKLDSLTFNGEYYEQLIDDVDEYKHQYGKGCLSDQLLGQQLAHVSGLGYVLEKEHIRQSVKNIFRYNFRDDFSDFNNLQRTYALNDDGGLLLCSWPKGGRPEIPFVYCDEVWSGIEYQVASHLIYEGFVDEGLKIVEACRARHDGVKRSPWNEVECGHHYARSLASYGVLLALTGFRCDAVNKKLYFNPAINREKFTGFFCCPAGWGLYHQRLENGKAVGTIETLYGSLEGYELVIT
ncbi:hypothetical protein AGMMS49928_22700 [Spirochaetia bacterium]|nr:hypothetical protein AGMMS49928_22700 [Spirochaetia bacterium]